MDAPTPIVIGTGTPTSAPISSVATSYYPSPPIDSSIDIEESIDVDGDSDELETDTQVIRTMAPLTCCTMSKHANNTRTY